MPLPDPYDMDAAPQEAELEPDPAMADPAVTVTDPAADPATPPPPGLAARSQTIMQLGLPSNYWRDNSSRSPLPDPVAARLADKTAELRNRVIAASVPVIDNNPTSFGANGGNDPTTGGPPVTDGSVQLARNDVLPWGTPPTKTDFSPVPILPTFSKPQDHFSDPRIPWRYVYSDPGYDQARKDQDQLDSLSNQATGTLGPNGYKPAPGDENLLARMLFAEGSDTPEDYPALGWAAVNRVGDHQFGSSLNDVLHQHNQFQFTKEGGSPHGDSPQWQASANPRSLTGANAKSWTAAEAAAKGIFDGTIPDPTGGAPFFFSSSNYVAERPETAPGGYPKMITAGTITPSPYVSQTPNSHRNYFFIKKTPK
jgi:hypothetical protein